MIYGLWAFRISKHRGRQREKYSGGCSDCEQEPRPEGQGDACSSQARDGRKAGATLREKHPWQRGCVSYTGARSLTRRESICRNPRPGKDRARSISEGDFHAGARGRGESFGGRSRCLARSRASSARWGLQPRRTPQPLSPSPALLPTIPAVQRLSFDVTPPAIAMEIEHHRLTPGPSPGLGGRKQPRPVRGQHGWVPKGTWQAMPRSQQGTRGPSRQRIQLSAHRIPPRSPGRWHRRHRAAGTADPSTPLLGDALLRDKSQTQPERGTAFSQHRLQPRLLPRWL